MLNAAPYADTIRADILESLIAYAQTGRPTDGFLRAVLTNDLMEAACRADDANKPALVDIVTFVRMQLPHDCHGSLDAVRAWTMRGGLRAYSSGAV